MSAQTYLAYDYPLLSAFWTMLVFFLWILWFVLLFRIIVDIFRDDGLNGWAKAGWTLFVCVLPFLGVFVYLIARGRGMGEREVADARARQEAVDSYVRQTAQSGMPQPSHADELTKLSEMRSRGDITDDEFRRAKELVLSGAGPARGPDSVSTVSGR
ncbi:SHOCT domain-containing protein [Streptomyces dangxiongensis]|uniref:SHOCT domain-containing protein n=1 Tax=Streptomyces dangxiongensis TaxID=1442032 RepID=A0A3G2JA40_9ACTN|nr:SHOCT domain-containing protein [Streptomyces dangxiongensis]AYN38285.1 SHOCT domain-containing protein [Streptomyces dangxiongensis]